MSSLMYDFLKHGDTYTPMEAFEAGYIDEFGNITVKGWDMIEEWELDWELD